MTRVSVLVATRDRPAQLSRCLPTVLANDHEDFEVLVLDQSQTDESREVIELLDDPRVRYMRLTVVGKTVALNAGLRQATGAVLAFTDDDCTVPADWLRCGIAALDGAPDSGIVFGKLAAVPHDGRRLYIPVYDPPRRRELRGRLSREHFSGVGANMFVREEVFSRAGWFDEGLGPGGRFRTSEDIDLAYRALRAGFAIVEDPTNIVMHWGSRAYATGEVRRLISDSYYGIGSCYARHLRDGDWAAGVLLGREILATSYAVVISATTFRRPTGARRRSYLLLGAMRGYAAGGAVGTSV